MKRLTQTLFGLFLFFFPFSIRFLVYDQNSYRFGNFNPWVSGFLYLPEVLLLVTFALWAWQKARRQETLSFGNRFLWLLLGLFAVNAFTVTFLQGDPLLGAFFLLRLFEAVVLFWLLSDRILEPPKAVTILILGAFLQVVWGYSQWKLNRSLGLSVLGESTLVPSLLGVAKTDLPGGLKQIRAYGSFLHPNILSAYLLTVCLIALRYLKRQSLPLWIALFGLGVYFAHSRAVALVGVACLALHFLFSRFKTSTLRKSAALALGLTLAAANLLLFLDPPLTPPGGSSVQERLFQNQLSQTLFLQNPWGMGVSQDTLALEKASPRKLSPWEFQPVHNTYFLVLNETGLQGLLLMVAFAVSLLWFYWKNANPVPLLGLLLLMPFDHYLWDSFAGMMLVGLVAGFFSTENK